MAITLDATTKTLELATSSTANIDYAVSFVDMTTSAFTPGDGHGTISSATTTVIVAAPAASTQRGVKSISIFNRHASTANTVTVKKDVSGTEYTLFKATLSAGESLQWSDGCDWQRFDKDGRLVINDPERSAISVTPSFFMKSLGGQSDSAGYYYCYSKDTGFPGAWSPGTPGINGRVTAGSNSADAGCLTPPTASGSMYISEAHLNASVQNFFFLMDVVWVNTGIVVTTTTAQTITTPTFPARDNNGSTNGDGYMIWLLVTTATTNAAAISNMTVTYTNSSGTPSRTAILGPGNPDNFPATAVQGTIVPFALAAGDKGVQSIQSITLGTSLVTGAVSLMVARPILTATPTAANVGVMVPFGTPGIRVYNDSCLIWNNRSFTSSGVTIMGTVFFRDV